MLGRTKRIGSRSTGDLREARDTKVLRNLAMVMIAYTGYSLGEALWMRAVGASSRERSTSAVVKIASFGAAAKYALVSRV